MWYVNRPQAGGLKCSEGEAISTHELLRAWGDFANGLDDWDWFITITFRPEHPASTAPAKKAEWQAWHALDRFVEQGRPAVGDVRWIAALEYQKARGVPHVHALLAGVAKEAFKPAAAWAWHQFGFTRILEYDPRRGAAAYLTKYVLKELGDVRVSPNLRRR